MFAAVVYLEKCILNLQYLVVGDDVSIKVNLIIC